MHPLIANEGNSGAVDSTGGGRDFSASLWTTWPSMQLLEGGKRSAMSSGNAHSPTMFCTNHDDTNETELFLEVDCRQVRNSNIESKFKL